MDLNQQLMELTVNNYIYDFVGEWGQRDFEGDVAHILKEKGVYGHIELWNAWMERGSSAGSYCNVAEMTINNQTHLLKVQHTDSRAWDEWKDPTSSEKRTLFLRVIENYDFTELSSK